ncbi:C6 finger domain-containing protein [Colletotrichum plurivorum]|uniref:C6 finger domain-containing protein n=1 Tax=Colletotrichum plurivorum TaxID=2175906 RepID=A0A8H6JBG0_9PEZI|nr:C6 finger domain-containing protein [Colletotrichum plurivorum]
MSLRKTSCLSCVAAKRRCDRALPACQRCSKQSLDCQYPYPPTAALQASRQSPQASPTYSSGESLGDIVTYSDLASNVGPGAGETELALGVGFDMNADWLADLCSFSQPENRVWPAGVVRDGAADWTVRTLPANYSRAKKQRMQSRQSPRDVRAYTSPSAAPSPVNALAKSYLGPWSRAEEVETWKYCANEMLSYISLYARTGSTPMMPRTSPGTAELAPVLAKALGICAAHETLGGSQRVLFDQMLDREMEELVESSAAAEYSIMDQHRSLEVTVAKSVSRLQALILYQIIRLFSDRGRDLSKAKAQEALFASWTRELQLQVQLLQQTLPACSGVSSIGPAPPSIDRDVLEAAYRTILISYEVRAVHSVLAYKSCPVWEDLFAIAVPPSLSGPKMLMYPDYVVEWDRRSAPDVAGDDKRFRDLIVAACKGVDAVRHRAA